MKNLGFVILVFGIFWNLSFDFGELEFMRINRIDGEIEVDGRPGTWSSRSQEPVGPFTLTETLDQDHTQPEPNLRPERPQRETSRPQTLYYIAPIPNVGMRAETPTSNLYVPHCRPQHVTTKYPSTKPVYICIV